MSDSPDDVLIPLAELCALFRRSRATLYRWAANGALPTVKVGGTVYMRQSDLDFYTRPAGQMRAQLADARAQGEALFDAETLGLIVRALDESRAALQRIGAETTETTRAVRRLSGRL